VKIGDLPEFVDPDYVAQVARVNAASLASLALAPAAPQEVKVKTAALDNGTDLVWKANAEPDVAGYRVVWRETTSPLWQGSRFVGNATTARIDMSKDNLAVRRAGGGQGRQRQSGHLPAAGADCQRTRKSCDNLRRGAACRGVFFWIARFSRAPQRQRKESPKHMGNTHAASRFSTMQCSIF
jgi:hypothetical protein